jgi:hypothetical protein
MSIECIAAFAAVVSLIIAVLCRVMIDAYKISYYETELKLRGVDISNVKNMGLFDIWRL